MANVFAIILRYVKSLDEIDIHLDAHIAFLEAQYRRGIFIASGPQVPRPGGAIIALGDSRETVMEIMKADPFHQHGLAEYQIFEFEPVRVSPGFAALMPID